jgi:hypothetical protein
VGVTFLTVFRLAELLAAPVGGGPPGMGLGGPLRGGAAFPRRRTGS